MRIALHSDLHMEFDQLDKEFLADQNFDVLVIAGDISVSACIVEHLLEIKSLTDMPIIFVAGNHDYYGDWYSPFSLSTICDNIGIHFLQRQSIEIDGVTFCGATGSSTLDRLDPSQRVMINSAISDFTVTKGWEVEDHILQGLADEEFFQDMSKITTPKVFISHFPPLTELNNPCFPYSALTEYFNNRYDLKTYAQVPEAWIFGHTHWNHDVMLSDLTYNDVAKDTRFISNQRGYPGELTSYNPNCIITV